MAKIYKYQKVIDDYTTHSLIEPDYEEDQQQITELCTLDGITYVSVPDTAELPSQPDIISETLTEVVLTEDLKAKIKSVSPHIRLINQRVVERIRERYSVNDELKMHRIGPTQEFLDYVEKCVAWGRAEKAKLGL